MRAARLPGIETMLYTLLCIMYYVFVLYVAYTAEHVA